MATTLRHGTMEDLDALLAFDAVAKASDERRQLIKIGLTNAEVTVALVDGVPKGYVLLNYRFYGQAFMELLYVAPDSRRTGLAARLIEHVQRHARGAKLFTSTNQSNHAMRSLLSHFGFKQSGVIHNLDPGDPELVFFKPLA